MSVYLLFVTKISICGNYVFGLKAPMSISWEFLSIRITSDATQRPIGSRRRKVVVLPSN